MTASYRLLKAERIKHVVVSGKTSFLELERLFQQFLLDPDFAHDLRILADLRKMTDAIAGLWEIHKLGKLYQNVYGDAVEPVDVVILVGDGIALRAARAFKLFVRDKDKLHVQITNSATEAQATLGVDNHVAETLALREPHLKVVRLPER